MKVLAEAMEFRRRCRGSWMRIYSISSYVHSSALNLHQSHLCSYGLQLIEITSIAIGFQNLVLLLPLDGIWVFCFTYLLSLYFLSAKHLGPE